MEIGDIWKKRLEKSRFKNLENFLSYFTSEDYSYTKTQLLDDINFYIDELLGFNDVEEAETIADDDIETDMIGW